MPNDIFSVSLVSLDHRMDVCRQNRTRQDVVIALDYCFRDARADAARLFAGKLDRRTFQCGLGASSQVAIVLRIRERSPLFGFRSGAEAKKLPRAYEIG